MNDPTYSSGDSGLAPISNAQIYYEIAGEGQPFVMLHAGVADSRQWNSEFTHFADRVRVLRYDRRGYGRSEPVEGEYSHLQDLDALLDYLQVDEPLVLMGSSMGGGLAMDYALERPSKVKALIMVGSAPTGLWLDVPMPEEEDLAEEAYRAGDLDRVAEIDTHLFFDGIGRRPDQVDQAMRQLMHEMDRNRLSLEAKGLGRLMPDTKVPAADRLGELQLPVLIVTGAFDEPYIHGAADYMLEGIPSARKVEIQDAAHLPNMDHPEEFRRIITAFLDEVGV